MFTHIQEMIPDVSRINAGVSILIETDIVGALIKACETQVCKPSPRARPPRIFVHVAELKLVSALSIQVVVTLISDPVNSTLREHW